MFRFRKLFAVLCLAGFLLVWSGNLLVSAQVLPEIDLVFESINQPRDRNTRPIVLDGRPIFTIAGQADADASISLNQRVTEIERNLNAIASTITDPNTAEISAEIEPDTRETVIKINGQYLMTVTTLDAQNQGLTVMQWASTLRNILRDALRVYVQERQWPAPLYQSLWASILLLVAIVISSLVERQWQKLKVRRQACEQQIKEYQQLELEAETISTEQIEKKLDLQEQLKQIQDQQRLWRIEHIFSWSAVVVICLGIFPHTRGWQYAIMTSLGGTVFNLFLVAVIALIAQRLSGYAISRLFNSLRQGRWFSSPRLIRRIKTFSGVITGVANGLIILVAGLVVLSILGVSTAPIVASLGFVGLGLSLSAQDIIRDILNGMLILMEDQFAEGDVITVNGCTGNVERMNLRITQLRNPEGALITIPNSAIRLVENLSNGWARVNLGIEVDYDTDLDRAMEVIQQVATQMSYERGWRQQIIDTPEVLGVEHFGNHSITILLWIKVQPLKQWEVAREYRLRLKKAFDEEGISMPCPQTEVWFRSDLTLNPPHSSNGTMGTTATGAEGIHRTAQ